MRDTLSSLRQAQGGAGSPLGAPIVPGAAATPSDQGPSESARLTMALQVGAKLNLPVALISRLQGSTPEEMEADAQTLLGVMGSGATVARGPGVPAVPAGGQPLTITRTQMQDPKFVRENADAIRRAKAEGRIVNS